MVFTWLQVYVKSKAQMHQLPNQGKFLKVS